MRDKRIRESQAKVASGTHESAKVCALLPSLSPGCSFHRECLWGTLHDSTLLFEARFLILVSGWNQRQSTPELTNSAAAQDTLPRRVGRPTSHHGSMLAAAALLICGAPAFRLVAVPNMGEEAQPESGERNEFFAELLIHQSSD